MKSIDLEKIKEKEVFLVKKNQDFTLSPNYLENTTLKKEIVFEFDSKNTTSKIIYYCVVNKKVNMDLKIILTSKKTNIENVKAYLEVHILNLSEDNYFSIEPILEIPQQNIVFEHKVTIGAPNKDWIKYLRSRGIPHNEARGLIAKGFLTGHAMHLQ